MYSAWKLNKQGYNIQPWCTPFPIWNQSVVSCPVLTVASWPAYRFLRRLVRWSGIPISWRIFQFVMIHTVKGFTIVNEAEVDVFMEFPCFFYDPRDVGNLIMSNVISNNKPTNKIHWSCVIYQVQKNEITCPRSTSKMEESEFQPNWVWSHTIGPLLVFSGRHNKNITNQAAWTIETCFLLILEAGKKSTVKVSRGGFLMRALFLACRQQVHSCLFLWKSPGLVQLLVTPWTIQSMVFSRPEYWSG